MSFSHVILTVLPIFPHCKLPFTEHLSRVNHWSKCCMCDLNNLMNVLIPILPLNTACKLQSWDICFNTRSPSESRMSSYIPEQKTSFSNYFASAASQKLKSIHNDNHQKSPRDRDACFFASHYTSQVEITSCQTSRGLDLLLNLKRAVKVISCIFVPGWPHLGFLFS